MVKPENYELLRTFFTDRRGDPGKFPDASIAIPVNAQGDCETVLGILNDIAQYRGKHTFEVILAINNYPEGNEPEEIKFFHSMGVLVKPTPNVRRPDEAICFSARMTGVKVANTECLLLFDADCRIPNATALIDWYIDHLQNGVALAYTHVGHYDVKRKLSIWAKIGAHHGARWVKRAVLGIPTTRGSNYAVNRTKMMWFYDHKYLSDDLNVGPTFKAGDLPIVYSGKRKLVVLTSGRVFSGGWRKLFRYLLCRLRYNMKLLPVGPDVTSRIRRGEDNIRRVKIN